MKWTPEMIGFLREVVPGSTVPEIREMVWHRFGVLVTPEQVRSVKKNRHIPSGLDCRFARGHVPANKGKRQADYMTPEGIERTKATRFHKGDEPPKGRAIPVGTERVGKDGYIQVKVRRFSGRPGANKCWESKAKVIWERAHGELPAGHIVVFADHDNRNFDLDNLVCVSKSDWAVIARNQIEYHDAESLQVAVDIARLRRMAYGRERSERACRRCGRTFMPRYPHQRTCDGCLGRRRPESTPRPHSAPNSDDQTETGIDAHGSEISD